MVQILYRRFMERGNFLKNLILVNLVKKFLAFIATKCSLFHSQKNPILDRILSLFKLLHTLNPVSVDSF